MKLRLPLPCQNLVCLIRIIFKPNRIFFFRIILSNMQVEVNFQTFSIVLDATAFYFLKNIYVLYLKAAAQSLFLHSGLRGIMRFSYIKSINKQWQLRPSSRNPLEAPSFCTKRIYSEECQININFQFQESYSCLRVTLSLVIDCFYLGFLHICII